MNRIYVDNAATTPISDTARRVLLETMDRAWGNPSSCTPSARRPRKYFEGPAGCSQMPECRPGAGDYLHLRRQ